jgi:site-specific DNA-methyltransferase (adenine-specific)
MSTDEGDIVLDPFNGTGTTVVAAKRLGRNYIGIELDKHYVSIATKKVKSVRADSKLGNVWISKYLNGIATIRDNDWDELKPYFHIPYPPPRLEYENIINKTGKIKRHKHIPQDIDEILILPFDESQSQEKLSAKAKD